MDLTKNPRLLTLNLDANQIPSLFLQFNTSLRELSVSSNAFTEIPKLPNPLLLRKLFIQNNQLAELHTLGEFQNLELLFVGGNPVCGLTNYV